MADRYDDVRPPPPYDHSLVLNSLLTPSGKNASPENTHMQFNYDRVTMNNAEPLPITSTCSEKIVTSIENFSSYIGACSIQGMDKSFNGNHDDKETIYGHPLFPLLAVTFEKCELATCTQRMAGDPVCSSESFNEDIETFTKKLKEINKGLLFTNNQELDNMMVQAIQNFLFHLIELEKVHELCDKFCERYITRLKEEMSKDMNVASQGDDDNDDDDDDNDDGDDTSKLSNSNFDPTCVMDSGSRNRPPSTGSLINKESSENLSAIFCEPHTGNTPAKKPTQKETRPMKIKGVKRETDDSDECNTADDHCSTDVNLDSGDGEKTAKGRKRQKKRGLFSKTATHILRTWLFQHLQHPYPSEEQKKQLGSDTGLTILQVNNWFINARRRIVQPMIDQTNRSSPGSHPHPSFYTESVSRIENHANPINADHRLPGQLPGTATLPMATTHTSSSYGGMHSGGILHTTGDFLNSFNSGEPYEIKPVFPTASYMNGTGSRYNMMEMCYYRNDMYANHGDGNSYYNIQPTNH